MFKNNFSPSSCWHIGEKSEPVNRPGGKNTKVVFSHYLYFGGNIPPMLSEDDQVGYPKFLNPSCNGAVADFHLRQGSSAIDAGTTGALASPVLALDGRSRLKAKLTIMGPANLQPNVDDTGLFQLCNVRPSIHWLATISRNGDSGGPFSLRWSRPVNQSTAAAPIRELL